MRNEDIAALRRRIEELEHRVAQLEDALGMSIEVPPGFRNQGSVRGGRKVWRLICGLAKRGSLNRGQAMVVLYGDQYVDEWPEPKIVDVFLVHVRRQLKPHGIKVDTIWGSGWSLDAENRARTQALIEQLQAGQAAPP